MCSELFLHKKGEKKTKRGEESERQSTTLLNKRHKNGKLATNVKPEMTPFHKLECKKKKEIEDDKNRKSIADTEGRFPTFIYM